MGQKHKLWPFPQLLGLPRVPKASTLHGTPFDFLDFLQGQTELIFAQSSVYWHMKKMLILKKATKSSVMHGNPMSENISTSQFIVGLCKKVHKFKGFLEISKQTPWIEKRWIHDGKTFVNYGFSIRDTHIEKVRVIPVCLSRCCFTAQKLSSSFNTTSILTLIQFNTYFLFLNWIMTKLFHYGFRRIGLRFPSSIL